MTHSYVVLLRGINVGGKNKIPMAELRQCLENEGYDDVKTYIQSGNVVLRSPLDANTLRENIEAHLANCFQPDSPHIKALVLTEDQLRSIVSKKPPGFGEQPDTYHSDVVFLMGIDVEHALSAFSPREGVDAIWPGNGVIYSRRVSAMRTKSRLNRIIGTGSYRSMTIRNWNTVTKLLAMLETQEP